MNIPFQRFAPEIQPVLDIVNVAIFTLALAGLFLTFYTLKREKERDRHVAANNQKQLLLEKERDREATEAAAKQNRINFSRQLYRDYLKVALDNPELSIAKYDINDKIVADQYDTFVGIMLYSFDEMISAIPEEIAYTIPVIEAQTEVHESFFRKTFSKDFDDNARDAYSALLLDIIDKKLDKLSIKDKQ